MKKKDKNQKEAKQDSKSAITMTYSKIDTTYIYTLTSHIQHTTRI